MLFRGRERCPDEQGRPALLVARLTIPAASGLGRAAGVIRE